MNYIFILQLTHNVIIKQKKKKIIGKASLQDLLRRVGKCIRKMEKFAN